MDFTKPNEGELLVRSHFTEDYAFTLYSSDYSIKKQFVASNFKGTQSLLNAVSSTNRRTLLISSFDYHIYEWVGDDVYRRYYFDQYKIGNSDIERHNHTAIWNLIKSGQKVSSPMAIAESDSFLLFYVIYLYEPIYYIYSLNKEVIYRLNDYYVTQTLPKCSIIGAIEDDVFYALVGPEDMMYFQKATKSELINIENDSTANPFLITFAISDT